MLITILVAMVLTLYFTGHAIDKVMYPPAQAAPPAPAAARPALTTLTVIYAVTHPRSYGLLLRSAAEEQYDRAHQGAQKGTQP